MLMAVKVRKAGGVVWDGLEADGKRLKLIRCCSCAGKLTGPAVICNANHWTT